MAGFGAGFHPDVPYGEFKNLAKKAQIERDALRRQVFSEKMQKWGAIALILFLALLFFFF